MKKLDKLVLSSFLGPFVLTFLVVVFILLTQHMLKYFDDIIGKGLGLEVIGQLLFYFAVFMTPIALPLAVLLSSLITFGNLGEHFELTAIKSSGVSLLRAIQPIFYFVVLLTLVAFYVNNNLVPKAALEAYSLLYDIKQKKPALDLREGTFYNGIPDISIKVNKKYPDGITLKDVIIYDHRKHDGNKDVTVADSGKMYTILNERYLKLELFDGYNYTEGSSIDQDMVSSKKKYETETLSRSRFAKTQVVFDLSSFQLSRTDKKWFQGNRIMRNLRELDSDLDSLHREYMNYRIAHYNQASAFFTYFNRDTPVELPPDLAAYKSRRDSLASIELDSSKAEDMPATQEAVSGSAPAVVHPERQIPRRVEIVNRVVKKDQPAVADSLAPQPSKTVAMSDSARRAKTDSMLTIQLPKTSYEQAVSKARSSKAQLSGVIASLDMYENDRTIFRIQWHKILASSLACIAMFLIGAPLGAIIKRGGLGVPFLVSILFFIIYYLLTMTGEKWTKQGIISVYVGVWAADVILFIIGMIFLRQARVDARLFDLDFYRVVLDKARQWLAVRRIIAPEQTS
jgi:lipopolysaccharide export system permease protein